MIYLIRHGETEWARDGRHTGRTDLPLTDRGRDQARLLRPFFEAAAFETILSSPLSRARETAELAGIERGRLVVRDDLREWDYGDYEGRTTDEIRRSVPDWTIWTHPCPNGETIAEIAARADRVIDGLAEWRGDCAVFSHAHFLRVLAARWLGEPPGFGGRLLFDTGSYSMLGFERDTRAIRTWNAGCPPPRPE